MLTTRKILFTAFEACVLDARSGSWANAQPAIDELERRSVPWVIFSGRTRAEMDPIRRKLDHGDPFVIEHGGGLFVPQGYFPVRIDGAERLSNWQVLPFAKPYAEAAEALEDLAGEAGVEVVGMRQMSLHEIAQNAGISKREAEAFRQRDFEEPFFFAGASEEAIGRFVALARERGFHAKPGPTFWTLSSVPDAGAAARKLAQLFRASAPARLQSQIVAIGAGPEDFAMLSAADRGILLPAEDASEEIALDERARRFESAKSSGPKGWAQAVLGVLGPQ